jgi:hypothetical protein
MDFEFSLVIVEYWAPLNTETPNTPQLPYGTERPVSPLGVSFIYQRLLNIPYVPHSFKVAVEGDAIILSEKPTKEQVMVAGIQGGGEKLPPPLPSPPLPSLMIQAINKEVHREL